MTPPLAPSTPSIPNAGSLIKSDSALRSLRIGRSKAGPLLDRQVRIAIEGSGKPSTRGLVPQTTAAVRLLNGPHGAKAEQFLRGSLSTLDARDGVSLRGIAFSSGADGYRLNGTLSFLETQDGAQILAGSGPKGRRAFVDEVSAANASLPHSMLGVYNPDSWVSLSPSVSKQLLAALTDGRTARSAATQKAHYVLAHELEHAVTPATRGSYQRHQWIEEGTAEVLSLQRHAARERSQASGLPPNEDVISRDRGRLLEAYKPYYTSLVSLLRLGGVDPTTAAGHEKATEILQGGSSLERVPGRLAQQILEGKGLGKSHYEPLRELIRDANADPKAITGIREYVESALDPT